MSTERPGRYPRSFSGMVGSMLVILLVVAGFVLFRDAIREQPRAPVRPLEYASSADYARDQADFRVLAPEPLPRGWVATSVRFEKGTHGFTWHLGTLTDKGRYVGLEQARRPWPDMVEEHVDPEAERGDDVTLDGEVWQSWTDAGDDLALVREEDGVTTVVVGRVPMDALEQFVGALA